MHVNTYVSYNVCFMLSALFALWLAAFAIPWGASVALLVCCGFLISQGGHFPQHSRQHHWPNTRKQSLVNAILNHVPLTTFQTLNPERRFKSANLNPPKTKAWNRKLNLRSWSPKSTMRCQPLQLLHSDWSSTNNPICFATNGKARNTAYICKLWKKIWSTKKLI